MSRIKRTALIISVATAAMLIIPAITLHTVKASAGMLVTLILFFVLHPIVSVVTGAIAGKDIKFFWFTPILIAGLFWAFSSLTYKTAFPLVYSAAYLAISAISMVIAHTASRKGS